MLRNRGCCCGGTPPVSCDACFGFSPSPLTITDSNATFTAASNATSPQSWSGGYTVSSTGADSVTPTGPPYTVTVGTISLRISYNVFCSPSTPPRLLVIRIWQVVAVDGLDVYCSIPAPSWLYAGDSVFAPINYCFGSGFTQPTVNSLSGGFDISQCAPLISSGVAATGGIDTPDPAPGTVTLTNTPRSLMGRWLKSSDPDRVRHARYKLRLLDNPDEPPGVLYAAGRYEPGNPKTWTPPTVEDIAMRQYLEKHGCGGCG